MTGRSGDGARTVAAFAAALLLLANLVPGTNWTTAPLDPSFAGGGYALVRVASGTAEAVAAHIRSLGATDVAALDALSVVTARIPAAALPALRTDARVALIAADGLVAATGRGPEDDPDGRPSAGDRTVKTREAWSRSTGRGVTVAVMDTGIADHPDLAGSVVGRFDFVHDGAPSLDPGGHGTFLAGLIAAHGATFKGVAPDAKLVSLRVLNANGVGTLHSVLAAFDWVLRNRTTYGIRVVNISWGTAQTTSYQRDLLAGVVESAWFAGVTVVAAAGNDGPLPGTVSSPAADPFVISAGSLDDDGTPAHEDDRESTFSGRGPTRDGFAKPDLLAPGEHVVSLRVPGTGPSPYRKLTGTSASAAFVSGAAALLLQAHASYSPTDVKGALVAGGYRVTAAVTPGLDAANALAVQPARVNADLAPSRVLISLLAKTGAFTDARQWGVSWEGVSWERLRWQTISWESVSWEAVSWDAVSWDAVTWEQRR